MTELCNVCDKAEPHGYVKGTGEYLAHTCLKCYRLLRRRGGENYIEGGDTKRSNHRGHNYGREDV